MGFNMKINLDEINKDIIEKIDSLDVGDNIKNFLKIIFSYMIKQINLVFF